MTAASATPQQMKERLLQAIDGQSNIRNMMAVLDVITHLERYPITKEALEETRLGKLINDVRKKSKDEELAKRAKKLLRAWRKLIEPGQNDTPPKEYAGTNGTSLSSRTDCSPQVVSLGPNKTGPELKICNDFHNCTHPAVETPGHRKRKATQKDSHHVTAKISKTTAFDHRVAVTPPPLTTNGLAVASNTPLNSVDDNSRLAEDKASAESLDHDRLSGVPVNAVKPRPSSPAATKPPRPGSPAAAKPPRPSSPAAAKPPRPGSPAVAKPPRPGSPAVAKPPRPGSPAAAKPPSASMLLKTAVLQQHAKDLGGGGGGGLQHPPKSPCSSAANPKPRAPDTAGRWPPPSVSSPAQSPKVPSQSSGGDLGFDSEPMPRSPNQTLSDGTRMTGTASNWPAETTRNWLEDTSTGDADEKRRASHDTDVTVALATDVSDGDASLDAGSRRSERKRKKYRPRDYMVNLSPDRRPEAENGRKPAKLKGRKLTFDPVTGQIKPMTQKEISQGEEASSAPATEACVSEPRLSDGQRLTTAPPPPTNPLQQTNWKELSRNEIIQSYLSLQSNVLTSSGTSAPGAHFFMSELLKRDEPQTVERHQLVPSGPATDLPGVTREVTPDDLDRLHTQQWPGVNGCYDNKDTWHTWTDCISLDPHGDQGKLHILPYVCLD